jgi:hypothetical protein
MNPAALDGAIVVIGVLVAVIFGVWIVVTTPKRSDVKIDKDWRA